MSYTYILKVRKTYTVLETCKAQEGNTFQFKYLTFTGHFKTLGDFEMIFPNYSDPTIGV